MMQIILSLLKFNSKFELKYKKKRLLLCVIVMYMYKFYSDTKKLRFCLLLSLLPNQIVVIGCINLSVWTHYYCITYNELLCMV